MIKIIILELIGALIGCIGTNLFWFMRHVGTLFIDTSGKRDVWRFNVENLEDIKKHKNVVLSVRTDVKLDSLDKHDL